LSIAIRQFRNKKWQKQDKRNPKQLYLKKKKMTFMEQEISTWNKVMSAAMDFPGVAVDKSSFLKNELGAYCETTEIEDLIKNGWKSDIDTSILDKAATACINSQTLKVTGVSAVAGLPGGFAMMATIPADMAQYYWHILVIAQKLAYIYGFPDIRDENGKLTDFAIDQLTLFVGAMSGVEVAKQGIKKAAALLAENVAKKLPQQALTKGMIYPIVKQVAKWLGVSLTKQSFSKGISKFIPLVGGLISGGLTYITFKPMAIRLQKEMKEIRQERQKETKYI
jgi:uncharacterized membrane protein